jgi:putative ABC transport system ATP-binding protein
MSAPLVSCDDLHFAFGESSDEVLGGVSVEIFAGEMVALVGPSGSGKTTLLQCLAGILAPTMGTVKFDGIDLGKAGDRQRARLRLSRMGFVWQFAQLVPELTLTENVSLPLELLGTRPLEARTRAIADLLRLGLDEPTAGRVAGEVSGGQAQRAAVARALVANPSAVFADEPTGALDSANGRQVLAALDLARSPKRALVVVTHSDEVAAHADRVIHVRDGRVEEL